MHKKTIGFLAGIFLILFLLRFFQPVFLRPLIFNGKSYCVIMSVLPFLFVRGRIITQRLILKKQLFIYVLLGVLNILSCYLFRNQPVWVSYWMWIPFFLILYYPIFSTWNWRVYDWEKTIKVLYEIFLICFILQFIFRNTTQLFILDTPFEYLEFESRVRIYSDSILYLGSFFCLNKYLSSGKKQYLFLYIIGTGCIFLQGFRMLLLSYIIISALLFFRLGKMSFRLFLLLFAICLCIGVSMETYIVKDKIEEITNRNERARFDDKNYVRVRLIDYYYHNHFENNIEMFLGSGIPHINVVNPNKAESSYSRECSLKAIQYHFFPADMGLLGLSWNAGVPFTFCFIILLLSIARIKVPSKYLYIGAWELFLIIIGLTNELSYNHANIIYQALVLTLLSKLLKGCCQNKRGWTRII